jgi:hypothetical protein
VRGGFSFLLLSLRSVGLLLVPASSPVVDEEPVFVLTSWVDDKDNGSCRGFSGRPVRSRRSCEGLVVRASADVNEVFFVAPSSFGDGRAFSAFLCKSSFVLRSLVSPSPLSALLLPLLFSRVRCFLRRDGLRLVSFRWDEECLVRLEGDLVLLAIGLSSAHKEEVFLSSLLLDNLWCFSLFFKDDAAIVPFSTGAATSLLCWVGTAPGSDVAAGGSFPRIEALSDADNAGFRRWVRSLFLRWSSPVVACK